MIKHLQDIHPELTPISSSGKRPILNPNGRISHKRPPTPHPTATGRINQPQAEGAGERADRRTLREVAEEVVAEAAAVVAKVAAPAAGMQTRKDTVTMARQTGEALRQVDGRTRMPVPTQNYRHGALREEILIASV